MIVTRTAELVDLTRSLHLLEPAQQDQVGALQARFPDLRGLARELIQRGWLTAYQINQIGQGRGGNLLLGSYVLLERLGEGGMGVVFKARNWKLGGVVALKLIRKDGLSDPKTVQRFRREIQVAAQLCHPNIIRAYDADEVGGTHFLVMEYVEGIDLGSLVRQRGRLGVAEACDCVRQAALGLQHAFERGLIHRDLKPSNLLRVGSGRGAVGSDAREDPARAGPASANPPGAEAWPTIKILDFGLARYSPGAPNLSSTLTTESTVMGTPDFMAPEQTLDSHDVDIRADLYSLGCTLYFLLTAHPPFPGGSIGQKFARHLTEEPVPVERVRPDVPPGLAAVVRKLLAKRPEDRYQTPAGLAAVLHFGAPDVTEPPPESGFVSTAVLPPPPARGRRLTRRHLLAGAGSALLLAGSGLALSRLLLWGKRTTSNAPTQPAGGQALGQGPLPLTRLDEAKIRPEDLAAAGLDEGKPLPDGLTAVLGDCREKGAGAFFAVAWSADGQLLAGAGEDGVIRLWRAVHGGEAQRLEGHSGRVYSLAFARDGSALASGGADYWVRVWDCATAKQRYAWRGAGQGHTHQVRAVACSPVEFLMASGSVDKKVNVWDLRQGSLLASLDGGNELVASVAFSPDGKVLASGCVDGQVKLWDAATRKPLGYPLPPQGRGVFRVAYSGDRRWLAVAYTNGMVRLWGPENRYLGPSWSAHPGLMEGLAFRPDDKVLATAGADGMVRLWDPDSKKRIQEIAVGPARQDRSVGHVAFSPDGRYLATANCNGTVYILHLAPPARGTGGESP
jgi:serine/threonine-protein kinase